MDVQQRNSLRELGFFYLSSSDSLQSPVAHSRVLTKLRERHMAANVEHDFLPIDGWQGDEVVGRAHERASIVIASKSASVSL